MLNYRIPVKLALVDRDQYIIDHCGNKKILHLGCTDSPYHILQDNQGRLLHPKILKVSSSVVGLDIDHEAIDWLRKKYPLGDYIIADIEDGVVMKDLHEINPDVILFPDVIEHLNNPGKALENLLALSSRHCSLIVTTPNAYAMKSFLRVVAGSELVHPDHVAFYSLYTLMNLLRRHGWEAIDCFSYLGGGKGLAAWLSAHFLRLRPALAEGIGLLCKPI